MKKILLVVLLVAAGCTKKGGADCDAAIGKGMDSFTANMKEHAPNPQILERMMGMVDKLKSTLTERCKADGWSADATTCFATVTNRKDMQGCQDKLTPDQKSKLTTELTQVMMGAMGGQRPGGMGGMPPGVAGHPGTLAPGGGSDSAAPAGAAPAPGAAPAAPAAPAAGGGSATPPAAGGAAAGSGSGGW